MAARFQLTLAAGLIAVAAPFQALAQSVGGPDFGELISLQSARDSTNTALTQVVRAATARGEAERRSMSASRPIEDYLRAIEEGGARSVTPSGAGESATTQRRQTIDPVDIPPLIEKHLLLMDEVAADVIAADKARLEADAYAAAKAKGVSIKILTAKSIENWGRLVVIVPPGEVIENDPMDVAHARLEDLSRRREELQAELRTKPTSDSMRSILRELAGIDRQINSTIYQITGVVWFDRGGKGSVCHPKAVKGRPVAWYNCDYWAVGVPFVVDPHGENIIVDRVRMEVDEGPRGFRRASIAYYTRSHGQPPSDEPGTTVGADFRYLPDGTIQLVTQEVDDAGEERERVFPIEVSTDDGRGLIPGFSNHGPFKLKFRRDPKAYISFEEAQAISRGVVTGMGSKVPGASSPSTPAWLTPDEDGLVPLVEPRPPPPPPPPPHEDDLELAPLTESN